MKKSRCNIKLDNATKFLLTIIGIILLLLILLCFCGCVRNPFTPTEIVKHPDAPMCILETKGEYARVAIYDSQSNKLIEYGWVCVDETLVGWTLAKYNWEKFIKEKADGDD